VLGELADLPNGQASLLGLRRPIAARLRCRGGGAQCKAPDNASCETLENRKTTVLLKKGGRSEMGFHFHQNVA
jgi:hypothetical protein